VHYKQTVLYQWFPVL